MLKVFNHISSVGPGGDTKDLIVGANKTVVIKAIAFSGPSAGGSEMKVVQDPGGADLVLALARGDLWMDGIPELHVTATGTPLTIQSQLSKTGGGAIQMGLVIYYEEHG